MIHLEGITKRYRIRGKDDSWKKQLKQSLGMEEKQYLTALSSITFDVKKGEIFGFLGPTGAGKTTMLKVIAGLLLPEEGNTTVNGFDIIKDRDKVRTSVNFLMSSGWIIFDYKLSVAYNLKFWGVVQGLRLAEVEKRVDEVLKIVGLKDRKNDFPENLSAGMRQKMNLARCLLVDRPVYLLDEPTSNVDPYSANFIREYIKKSLKEEGKAIILATHNLWEAEILCDRVAILNKGKILMIDSSETIKKKIGKEMVVLQVKKVIKELIKGIQSLDFVDSVSKKNKALTVIGDVKKNLPELLDECRKYTDVENIEMKEPSLQEVFMEIIDKAGAAHD